MFEFNSLACSFASLKMARVSGILSSLFFITLSSNDEISPIAPDKILYAIPFLDFKMPKITCSAEIPTLPDSLA